MIRKTKHIISVSMMLLILFSTIGFNIISTFCDGCNNEHTTVAIAIQDQDIACECCSAETDYEHCCSSTKEHRDNHHHSKSLFAKLKFDSPEAKSKTLLSDAPVFVLQFASVLFDFNFTDNNSLSFSNYNIPPPLGGREILAFVCVLRN